MNKLLLIILTVTLSLPMMGQSDKCATESPTYEQAMQTVGMHLPYMDRPEGGVQYVPIKFHVVRQNDGSGGQDWKIVLDQLCFLNDHYAETGIYFWLFDSAPHFIDDDNFYFNDPLVTSHSAKRNQLLTAHNTADVTNIYFVGDWSGLCGISSFPGGAPAQGGMVLGNGCAFTSNHKTFPHEMGHYFNLYHPHETLGCSSQENVDRLGVCKNCETTGDLMCDTPADPHGRENPGDNCGSPRWNCPDPLTGYTDNCDPGATFEPDGSLYMSYAEDACQTHFSLESQARQIASLNNDRPYLLNYPDPNTDVVGDMVRIYPEDDATEIPYNDVTLTWEPTPNAQFYYVKLIRGVSVIETGYVSSESYHIQQELLYDAKYRWTVFPYSSGNTCGNIPINWEFRTDDPTVGIAENEALSNSITVYPNPVTEGQVEFRFNKAQTEPIQIQIMNVTGQLIQQETIANTTAGYSYKVNIDNLNAGVYFAKITGENAEATKKFVVLN